MSEVKNEIMKVDQLPVITERLKAKSEEVAARVAEAKAAICTEDTVKSVKSLRAGLNKEFAELESQRLAIREKILEPYEAFNAVYKELIADKYKSADTDLKTKIETTEDGLKAEREAAIKAYYDEYAASLHVSSYTYDRAGINVTLNASTKSLKEKAKAFADKVHDDLLLIGTQQYPSEIAVEYEKSLNVSGAIRIVLDRHLAVEKAEVERQKAAEAKAEEAKHEEQFADFMPPPVAPVFSPPSAPVIIVSETPVQLYMATFKVTGTKDQLIALREFMKNGGYKYE